jgi:transposase
MLQLTPQQRFFLAVEHIDFRNGINGIIALCKHKLQQEPMSGAWFVFTNRKRTALKLLVYDGQGFWLCMKRFSQGKLAWWPKEAAITHSISAQHLTILLHQGNPTTSNIPPDWRRI